MAGSDLQPVILAGGAGSRLWPLSKPSKPKPFLCLVNDHSMLQNTVLRLQGLAHLPPLVVCNTEHRHLAAEQLRQINWADTSLLLEPEGRNTAPAVTLAALQAASSGQDPLLLVLAADHVIRDERAFRAAVTAAIPLAEQGSLVTFGIVPTRAETEYGYIWRGKEIDGGFQVAGFVEKPDAATAAGYLARGDYYWNSGLFLFRASAYLAELRRFAPAIATACERALCQARGEGAYLHVDASTFAACPNEAIDTAVMERTKRAVVVPLNAGWRDIGNWSALRAALADPELRLRPE